MIFLTTETFSQIYPKLDKIWEESGAWPDYIKAMRQTLAIFKLEGNQSENISSLWVSLPSLCCQGAGGDPGWAEDFTLAWLLFYVAADLMDDLQDQDAVDPWWKDLGTGVALNIASGLFFSASFILNKIERLEATKGVYPDLIRNLYNGFLIMCSGQHRDLISSELTLEQYWETVGAKSGAFFSMACRGGARLATDNANRLEGFAKFGHHLGILIQILDDLEEIRPSRISAPTGYQKNFKRCLASVFALEMSPPSTRKRLETCLNGYYAAENDRREALELINQSGAALYIVTEIERHRAEALAGLDQADPNLPERKVLSSFLQKVYPI